MVADSVFAPADSPYSHTSDALWTLWCIHDRTYGSAVLSGTYADKGGYHNKRENLPSSDYSSGRDVRNDDYGPGNQSAGLDVSMNPNDMETWTKRLKSAATSNDPRLKIGGEWILREFIGTLDSKIVYCWVFTGGEPLGVGSDSGPDPGRDSSHLWHGHLSVIRKFLNNMAALQQIGSIVSGQSLAEWEDDEMDQATFNARMDSYFKRVFTAKDDTTDTEALAARNRWRAIVWQYVGGGIPEGKSTLGTLAGAHDYAKAIADAYEGVSEETIEEIEQAAYSGAEAGAAAGVNPDAIAASVLAGLQAAGLDPDQYADAVENAVREVFADAGTADTPAGT